VLRGAVRGDRRLLLALVLALASDAAGVFVEPLAPVQWTLDGLTALALIAVLGLNWRLVPALLAEAVPGLGLMPFWVLVVLWIGRTRRAGAAEGSYDPPAAENRGVSGR
jgi:hypothetical protein